jgi:hypothetical protein
VNGAAGQAPVMIEGRVGDTVTLDAAGTTDPDRDALTYRWFFYAEAGTGIPSQPVYSGGLVTVGGGGSLDEGGIPSASAGGPPQPKPRVTVVDGDTARASVRLDVPGVSHVILAVEDSGTPSLTAYRRVIIRAR